jgi:hypothetical protein
VSRLLDGHRPAAGYVHVDGAALQNLIELSRRVHRANVADWHDLKRRCA